MKKVVLKLELCNEKGKKKAMKAILGLEGLVSMDMEDKKLTVTGDMDPVQLVARLRKLCRTEIVSVGPAKEEKKKEESKKEIVGPAKQEEKKEKLKKKDPMDEMTELTKADQAHYPRKSPQDEKKVEPKEEPKKKDPKDEMAGLIKAYQAHYPPMPAYYYVRSSEEDPNTCVVC